MSWRTKKRIKFISILSIPFILALIFLISYRYYYQPPSCDNGIKDQNEEDIDCGGVCLPCEIKLFKPLEKQPAQFLIYENKTVDFLGIIRNPNSNLAVKKLKYQFLIYDQQNNLKATTEPKETFILPLETKYIIENKYPLPSFEIGWVDLKIFDFFKEDIIKKEPEPLLFNFYNEKIFKETFGAFDRWRASLTIFNSKFIPYNNVEIFLLLYNKNKLIALTKTVTSFEPEEAKSLVLMLPEFKLDNEEPDFGIKVHWQYLQWQ